MKTFLFLESQLAIGLYRNVRRRRRILLLDYNLDQHPLTAERGENGYYIHTCVDLDRSAGLYAAVAMTTSKFSAKECFSFPTLYTII